uniref:Reverse transcriptase domain-containing protein n=1 Tax=Tanacetum cinerariifolium TaxID=118510 RepID=A0A699QHB5_TANCI|nr:hypothetical protein [Tanacetum cinerariifolium]
MRHDTSSYSNQPQKESINMINICDNLSEDFLKELFTTTYQSGNLTFSSHPKLTSPEVKDDVFDPDHVLKPLFPSPIPFEDSVSFLKKSDILFICPYTRLLSIIRKRRIVAVPLFMLITLFPKYEFFYFDIEEKKSGSTIFHADISLLDLESFNFDFKPDPRMKIPFLTPASQIIISLLYFQMYPIGVKPS